MNVALTLPNINNTVNYFSRRQTKIVQLNSNRGNKNSDKDMSTYIKTDQSKLSRPITRNFAQNISYGQKQNSYQMS